jgi:hypothetical protein
MSIRRVGWKAAALFGAALIGASAAPAAEQIGSRVQGGSPAAPVLLRSQDAPTMEVWIAPSQRQLADAALESAFGTEGAPPLAKILGIKPPGRPGAPRRVGSVFPANHESTVAQWQLFADGTYVTHLNITSVGALGIRARLQLPAGVTLGEMRTVANPGDVAEVVPLWVAGNGEIWTPYTDGETQIVEILSRQNVPGTALKVLDIVHFEESLNSKAPPVEAQTMAAGTCSPDVVCTSNDPVLDAAIADRAKSVARINFQSGTGSFLCSGTLINSNSRQNFFLTANHCISNQAEASSIQTRWFYEATVCGGGTLSANPNAVTVGGGAALTFTNQFVDQTLLTLNLAPPAATVFAGWNAAAMIPGSSIVSISHPAGDVMKFALGTNTANGGTDGLTRLQGYEQSMYSALFSRGVIEGGSSGSGLFVLSSNNDLQLRGVLSNSTVVNGVSLSCTHPEINANYGRWDYFQPQVSALLDGAALPVDDHPNQPTPTATLLPLNGAGVTGRISYVGDIDVFRIVITEPGTLYVKSSGGFDLIAELMGSNGSTLENAAGDLATNDDASVTGYDFGLHWAVTPGTYYLATTNYTPTDLTPTPYTVSASFVNATSNYTSLWWGGAAESGWGMNLNHQGNAMFATMFNYENAGLGQQNPNMWLVASLSRSGTSSTYTGRLLRVRGPAFNASPFPGNAFSFVDVGPISVSFSGDNAGTLTYSVQGDGTGGTGSTVTKSISRQTFGTLPVCEFTGSDRTYAAQNFQDLWWNPAESGWGINLTHQSTTIFATLFTFEAGTGNSNKGLWLTSSMTRQSAGVYSGQLVKVTGSAFDAVPFVPLNPAVNATIVGNMRVEFTDGNTGTLTYDINGQSVTKSIQREVFGSFPTECTPP